MDPIERASKVKQALFMRGVTLSDVDRHYDLPRGTSATTLREPNPRGEEALAAALAYELKELWPERYNASGQRLSPQPAENYRRPPTMAQRRNRRAA